MAGIWETGGLITRVFSALNTTGISATRLSFCFVFLDMTAFAMHAVGGSMMISDTSTMVLRGIHIYMGGIGLQEFFIGLQEFFILGFTTLVVRFHYKIKHLEGSTEWKRPLYTMYTSLGLITLRILFRLIEFSSGVYSPITMHEAPFHCLDALPMYYFSDLTPGAMSNAFDLTFGGRIQSAFDVTYNTRASVCKRLDVTVQSFFVTTKPGFVCMLGSLGPGEQSMHKDCTKAGFVIKENYSDSSHQMRPPHVNSNASIFAQCDSEFAKKAKKDGEAEKYDVLPEPPL
ncbi:hypothetical protein B0H19DRAFT_1058259 [Mycena capillaripes]|nr:hypothetical protein B0H19DRAFT_1058259 [Mycena capillaripes]